MLVNQERLAEENGQKDANRDISSGSVSDNEQVSNSGRSSPFSQENDDGIALASNSSEFDNEEDDDDDEYSEAFKSLSLKGASLQSTPKAGSNGESSINNADIPKKEIDDDIEANKKAASTSNWQIQSLSEDEEEKKKKSQSSEGEINSGSEFSENESESVQSDNDSLENKTSSIADSSCCAAEEQVNHKVTSPCCKGGKCSKKSIPIPQSNAQERRGCTIM